MGGPGGLWSGGVVINAEERREDEVAEKSRHLERADWDDESRK